MTAARLLALARDAAVVVIAVAVVAAYFGGWG